MIKKKGFTLVELLAVIVILAIILVIAVPQIMDTIDSARKASIESSAKMVAAQVENQYTVSETLGTNFPSSGDCTTAKWAGLNDKDYESCTYSIDSNGKASVTLVGKGKFEGKSVCDGTRSVASVTEGECKSAPPVVNCTYDGVLVQGAEFTHNQYTYRYKQEYHYYGDEKGWINIENDGWGVILTDKASTEPVNTPLCTYINGKPLVSTTSMFVERDSNDKKVQSQAESIDVSLWNTSTVTNMTEMFLNVGYKNENVSITGLETLDTSNVTNMSSMFYNFFEKSSDVTLDISNWDTSNVTDMSYMFYAFGYYNENANVIGIETLDTSNVTNMTEMFSWFGGNWEEINLDLSGWDTSNVTDMTWMFYYFGEKVETVNLNLREWNTSNVTDMYGMFESFGFSITTVTLDISNWDTSNVTDMSRMFCDSWNYATTVNIIGLEMLDTSNVSDMTEMFNYAFVEGPEIINLDLSNWDTSNVANMSSMFWCFGGFGGSDVTLNISNWDTSNVTDMTWMLASFGEEASTVTLDVSNWDTSNATDMSDMFHTFGSGTESLNLILGNKFTFGTDYELPSYSWIKTHDINGNNLSDRTQYTTDELITFTESTTPTIGGTWSKVS